MSQDLLLHTTAGAIVREARRTGVAISRIQGNSQVRQAAVDAEFDVSNAKEDANTTFTLTGMAAIARVGLAEQAVVLNLPGLSGRIAGLAERHALATYELHDDLAHRVRRL